MSKTSLIYLDDITRATNASVKYDKAAEPAVAIIKRRAWPVVVIGSNFT